MSPFWTYSIVMPHHLFSHPGSHSLVVPVQDLEESRNRANRNNPRRSSSGSLVQSFTFMIFHKVLCDHSLTLSLVPLHSVGYCPLNSSHNVNVCLVSNWGDPLRPSVTSGVLSLGWVNSSLGESVTNSLRRSSTIKRPWRLVCMTSFHPKTWPLTRDRFSTSTTVTPQDERTWFYPSELPSTYPVSVVDDVRWIFYPHINYLHKWCIPRILLVWHVRFENPVMNRILFVNYYNDNNSNFSLINTNRFYG